MTNKELKSRFDEASKPRSYKKKGNKWTLRVNQITKGIYLQKSGYSNLYYVNYGVDFNDLDYEPGIFQLCLRCNNTLDLEVQDDSTIEIKISECLEEIFSYLDRIENPEDAKELALSLPTLNIVPLKVKAYLELK